MSFSLRNNVFMRTFSLRQVVFLCVSCVLIVIGAEYAALRLGYLQKAKSGLTKIGLLEAPPSQAPYKRIIDRTAVLNHLVNRYGHKSYLEIGQGSRAANLDWIGCRIKVGVDPDSSLNAAYQMTSDEFFAINKHTYDLIFVDGLHHAEQAFRDIVNSLAVLNENGSIVVHDCNPTTEEMQLVPRIQPKWTGDVWKAWAKLRATRPDLKMFVIDIDSGCGIIRKGRQETIDLPSDLTYGILEKNREKILNLVNFDSFLRDLNQPGS